MRELELRKAKYTILAEQVATAETRQQVLAELLRQCTDACPSDVALQNQRQHYVRLARHCERDVMTMTERLQGTAQTLQQVCGTGGSLTSLKFFLVKDRPQVPPTANCQPLPTANRQRPTTNRRQPPPTANRQTPTANGHQPPTASRQPPTFEVEKVP